MIGRYTFTFTGGFPRVPDNQICLARELQFRHMPAHHGNAYGQRGREDEPDRSPKPRPETAAMISATDETPVRDP